MNYMRTKRDLVKYQVDSLNEIHEIVAVFNLFVGTHVY